MKAFAFVCLLHFILLLHRDNTREGRRLNLSSTAMETLDKTTRILKSYLAVVICYLFFGVESFTGEILPPQNVTLTWPCDFFPHLSWIPPQHSMENCSYELITNDKPRENLQTSEITNTSWSRFRIMEGGHLYLFLSTVCGERKSNSVSINTTYPDLVEDLQCFFQSSKLTYCTWLNSAKTKDLRFFYNLKQKNSCQPVNECSSYTGSDRTGCHLQAEINDIMDIVINGTVDNRPVRNTFRINLREFVKPLALTWAVDDLENEFNISWIRPDVPEIQWIYRINYTECEDNKSVTVPLHTFHGLPRVPHCPYTISIQAQDDDYKTTNNESPWSDVKHFDALTDPNASLYALIIIPLMFAGLAALTFVCFRKYKENIFPKIPQPPDLISDISNNNNKNIFHNLYIPPEEEENCKITLVMEPQTDKPYS